MSVSSEEQMKPCPKYTNELAAAAGPSENPSASLLAHLKTCPGCQQAFVELREVASVHGRAAREAPAPSRGIQLDQWFQQSQRLATRSGLLTPFRLSLGLGIAAVVLLFLLRGPQPLPPVKVVESEARESQAYALPSWQAFRRELGSEETDRTLLQHGTASLDGQYRLKSAYLSEN